MSCTRLTAALGRIVYRLVSIYTEDTILGMQRIVSIYYVLYLDRTRLTAATGLWQSHSCHRSSPTLSTCAHAAAAYAC